MPPFAGQAAQLPPCGRQSSSSQKYSRPSPGFPSHTFHPAFGKTPSKVSLLISCQPPEEAGWNVPSSDLGGSRSRVGEEGGIPSGNRKAGTGGGSLQESGTGIGA
jgi:hypothetical protein